jgi:hypothetical protein
MGTTITRMFERAFEIIDPADRSLVRPCAVTLGVAASDDRPGKAANSFTFGRLRTRRNADGAWRGRANRR